MRRRDGESEASGKDNREAGADCDRQKKVFRAGENVRDQTFAREFFQQLLSQKNRGDGTCQGSKRRPSDRYFVTSRAAAVDSGNPFEVVIRAIGKGDKRRRDEEQDENHDPISVNLSNRASSF